MLVSKKVYEHLRFTRQCLKLTSFEKGVGWGINDKEFKTTE